jgi:hypothetical protein
MSDYGEGRVSVARAKCMAGELVGLVEGWVNAEASAIERALVAESRVTELTAALRCAALNLDSAAVFLHDSGLANIAASVRASASAARVSAGSKEAP